MIYLDNAATTRPCAEATAAVTAAMTDRWGNPSAAYALGLDAEKAVSAARRQVALALGAEKERVFFTSGGTEADNWAIFSAAERMKKRGRHIVTTAVEHHAVLHPMQKLESLGFEVTYLSPDGDGFVSAEKLERALREDTVLVSVMMVNNETGAVMPLEEMIRAVRRRAPTALFHTDAVQGFGKVPFRAKSLGADLISVSGHKVHATKGIGALYIRPGLTLPPLILGGGQEENYRSGTEPVPAISGFGAACAKMDVPAEIAHMARLRDLCREELSRTDGVVLLGKQDAPHVVALSLPHLRSQGIVNCLQQDGICVSAGSACSRGHRSHVLEAMRLPPEVIDGAVRVSFSRDNTEEDALALVQSLKTVRTRLRG